MKKKKIKIIGAGIAGLTASIVLSKGGYDVEVYEKAKDVGSRFNNDFQGIMNWGFEEDAMAYIENMGFDSSLTKKPVKTIDIFSPASKKSTFTMSRPFVYLVKRGSDEDSLDSCLKKKAVELGVKISFNCLVEDFNDANIVATGPDFERMNVMAMGFTFDTDSSNISSAIFDNKFSYKGYSYLFISEGKGTVATCCFGKFNKMPQYLDKSVKFFQRHYNFKMKSKKRFSGFGHFNPFLQDEKRVGEAAGFQDYLWGFGIRYAMISGEIMARSIIEGKNYDSLCQGKIESMMKTSIFNRMWFSWLRGFSYRAIIAILERKDPMRVFTRVYNSNFISKIFYPFAKICFYKKQKNF